MNRGESRSTTPRCLGLGWRSGDGDLDWIGVIENGFGGVVVEFDGDGRDERLAGVDPEAFVADRFDGMPCGGVIGVAFAP